MRVRTAGLSLLTAKVSVVDEEGALLGTAQSVDRSRDVTLTLDTPPSDSALYVIVEGVGNNERSIGGYALIATIDELLSMSEESIDFATNRRFRHVEPRDLRRYLEDGEDPLQVDDLHTDDDFLLATELDTMPGFAKSTRYQVFGSITDDSDVDYYSVETPESHLGSMIVSVTSTETSNLIPVAHVFDDKNVPLPTTVLINGDGQYTIQIEDYEADTNYLIRIANAEAAGPFHRGLIVPRSTSAQPPLCLIPSPPVR